MEAMSPSQQEAARLDPDSDQLAPDDPQLAALAVVAERSSELPLTVMMTMSAPISMPRSSLDARDARRYTNRLRTQPPRLAPTAWTTFERMTTTD
jgi:hypothetical protein